MLNMRFGAAKWTMVAFLRSVAHTRWIRYSTLAPEVLTSVPRSSPIATRRLRLRDIGSLRYARSTGTPVRAASQRAKRTRSKSCSMTHNFCMSRTSERSKEAEGLWANNSSWANGAAGLEPAMPGKGLGPIPFALPRESIAATGPAAEGPECSGKRSPLLPLPPPRRERTPCLP